MFDSADVQTGVLDGELLAQYVSTRSHEAFGRIVDRHMPVVYSICLRLLNDPHAAEDAAQATFMVLFRRADSSGARGCLAGWLCATARLCARNVQVSTQRRIRNEARAVCSLPNDTNETVDPNPAEQCEWETVKPHLDDALATLPAPQRDAIVLRYFRQLSIADAAREMNCPEPTLVSRVQNGLRRLREKLRRKGAPISAALLAALLAERSVHAAPASLCAAAKIIHASAASASPIAASAAGAAIKTLYWSALVPWLAAGSAALISMLLAIHWFVIPGIAMNSANANPSIARPVVAAAPAVPVPAPPVPVALPTPERFDDAAAWPVQGNLPIMRTADALTVNLVSVSPTPVAENRINDFCLVVNSKKWKLVKGPVSCHVRMTIPSAPATGFEIGLLATLQGTGDPVKRRFGLTYDGGQVLVSLNSELAKIVPGRIVTYDYRGNSANPLLGESPKLGTGAHDLEFTVTATEFLTRVDGAIIYQKPHGLSIEDIQFGFTAAVKKGNTTPGTIIIDHPAIHQYEPAAAPEPKEF